MGNVSESLSIGSIYQSSSNVKYF